MKKTQPIFLPLVLATTLAVGLVLVWTAVLAWSVALVTAGGGFLESETLGVSWDGTPIITKYNYLTYQQTYRTLDGKKLDKDAARGIGWLAAADLGGPQNLAAIEIPLAYTARIQPISDLPYSMQTVSDENPSSRYWYFIHDGKREGKGYFAGFDSKSRQNLGYLGRQGFSKDIPPIDQWFAMDGRLMGTEYANYGMLPKFYKSQEPDRSSFDYPSFSDPAWKTLMLSGDDLLRIDLQTGKTVSLLRLPGMISLSFISDNRKPLEKGREDYSPGLAAVRTFDRVITFDVAGKIVHEFVIPEKLRDRYFSFYDIGKEQALIIHQKRYLDAGSREGLTWIDHSGKILRQEEVELTTRSYPPNPKENYRNFAICAESPLAMLVFGIVGAPMIDVNWMQGELDYSEALRLSWAKTWLPLLVLVILAAILAYLCYRRQRQYAQPWTWLWVGFVFLAGLPGYLAYLFHRRWPVLEVCPQCKQNAPRDRESCSACGTPFPPPELKGIEVFAERS